MLSVEEALTLCLDLVRPLSVETVALRHAAGRVMPGAARAERDQPPFAASAMDGYAVLGDPVAGDGFQVIGEAGAGHSFAGSVGLGQTVRIFTGAPVPDGATRVIIQEDVAREGQRIVVQPGADTGRHIRPMGQDFRQGDPLGPRRLGPNDLALLASMNVALVAVTRRPVVAIIATGDELVMPGETPRPDQIIASNSFALAAMVEAAGGEVRLLPIARDTEADLRTVLELAAGADLILTIGGASVGDYDLVGRVTESLGMDRAFWRIAMRPGKPLMAGRLGGAALLGLPGNPVSAVVCGHLFVLPMLRAMLGLAEVAPQVRKAALAVPVGPTGPRAHYMRATLDWSDALPRITPFERQDSALLSVLSQADALLIRPLGEGALAAGAVVGYLTL